VYFGNWVFCGLASDGPARSQISKLSNYKIAQ
jgi:hypothetical protein